MPKIHWFQFVAYSILSIFMGLMIYVCYIAYTRPSGFTGLDIAKMQQIRYEDIRLKNLPKP
jgi:hypothetical protein